MNKHRLGLIAGCSHAAGAEIDGSMDSEYNRNNSFGSVLSNKLGYTPVNIALNGATNSGIARSILEWFETFYNPDETEVFVCIAWTESARLEVPATDRPGDYISGNPYVHWFDKSADNFYRINYGWKGSTAYEKQMIPSYQEFMANNQLMLENWTAQVVLMTEYFLKFKKINYVMCNTMHMFRQSPYTSYLVDKIDSKFYYNPTSTQDESFYWKYKNLGYANPKAQYWHHNEEPHRLFADELYDFVKRNNIC